MGRPGLETCDLGIKVLHIDGKPNLKERHFERMNKPFRDALKLLLTPVLSRTERNMARFALHSALSRAGP